MNSARKRMVAVFAAVFMLLFVGGCGEKSDASQHNTTEQTTESKKDQSEKNASEDVAETTKVTFDKQSGNSENSFTLTVSGYDSDDHLLWEWMSEEIMETELEPFQDLGRINDTYYYQCGGNVYCVALKGEDAGKILWENHEFLGEGAHWSFDKNGELWLCGGYGPALMHIDTKGKTVQRLEGLPDEYAHFYWPEELTIADDGDIRIRYESIGGCLYFDPETLEVLSCVMDEETYPEKMIGQWQGESWEIEGDVHMMAIEGMKAVLTVREDGRLDFEMHNEFDDLQFKEIPYSLIYGRMYGGAETVAGPCYIVADVDEENYLQVSAAAQDTLEMLWYRGAWTEEEYPVSLFMIFTKVEK